MLSPARTRAWLAAHARLAYVVVTIAFALGVIALVAHGVVHGSLPQDSLNFRWRYWVAAYRLWTHRVILGVGWGNFGPHYLAYRLPAAAEEVRDPHDLFVRAFAELGLVGGVLTIAWVARAAWELTRPTVPPLRAAARGDSRPGNGETTRIGDASPSPLFAPSTGGVISIALVALLGPLLNAIVAIDWSQPGSFLVLEVFRRVLAVGLLFVGLMAATAHGGDARSLDERPAPWVLYGVLVGLGVFFIHTLMDFVLAEPGPLTLFAVLLGAALGVRTPSVAGARPRRGVAIAAVSIGVVAWLVAVFAVVIPVADAEDQATRANDALRQNRADLAAGLFRGAYQTLAYNADYATRAARALMLAGAPSEQVLAMLDVALATDPYNVETYAMRAGYLQRLPSPDGDAILRDYGRALALDPNNVPLRLDYADALEKLGDPRAAAEQYRDALRHNDLLNPDEPRRLSPERVREVEEHVRRIEKR
jgi:hypothetical protein